MSTYEPGSHHQPGQSAPWSGSVQQHPGSQYPGSQYPGQPYAGQPYPGQPYPGAVPSGQPSSPVQNATPQRPAEITFATTLMVTAGLQVACLAGFVWLVIIAGMESFSATDTTTSSLWHLLNRAHLALSQGVWVPVFGFPLATFVLGFLALMRALWPRLVITALGIGCSAWLLIWQGSAGWWRAAVAIAYIAVCCALLWTPGSSRWYRGDRAATRPTGSGSGSGVGAPPAPEPEPRRWWDH